VTRVWLRPVLDDDVVLFFEHQADREASMMAAFSSRSLEDHLAHWNKIRSDATVVTRAIVTEEGVAGNIVSWLQEDHREVGYWIDKRFWGRGIASAALRAFLEIELERPLYAFVADHNMGSIKVLERCGFKPERTETNEGLTHLVMMLR
jgi:RimJ/RimL family protein N-acetyltransferase